LRALYGSPVRKIGCVVIVVTVSGWDYRSRSDAMVISTCNISAIRRPVVKVSFFTPDLVIF